MSAINISKGGNNTSFNTPLKYPSSSLATNPSFAISTSFVTNTFDYSQSKGSPSYQLLKDYNMCETESIRGQQMIDNNSALTLNPVISPQDIEEILTMQKLIGFYSKQEQEQRHTIVRRQHRIEQLKQQIETKEENIKYHKQKYNRTRKSLTKSKSKKKIEQKRKQQRRRKQIENIEIEINTLRKKYEHIKYPKPTMNQVRKILRQEEQRARPRQKKNIIYVPMPMPLYGQPYQQPYPYHYSNIEVPQPQSDLMMQSQTWSKSGLNPRPNSSRAPGPHKDPTFQKLFSQMRQNPEMRSSNIDNNIGLITDEDVELAEKLQARKSSYKISVNKVGGNNSPRELGYFNDDQSQISWKGDQNEREVKSSKKSVDKWIGDDDDMQTVQLIEKSTSNRLKRRQENKERKSTLDPDRKRGGIAAKIVTSNLCQMQRTESNSASKVDISFESQGREPNGARKNSGEKRSLKQSRNSAVVQSHINIMVDSLTSPVRNSVNEGSPSSSSIHRKNAADLEKKISSIMEEDQQAVSTPLVTPNSNSKFNPPSKIRNSNQSNPRTSNRRSSLQYTNSGLVSTPPIDKPPCLADLQEKFNLRPSKQDQQLASIKLSAQSIASKKENNQKTNSLMESSKSEQMDDSWDDLKLTLKSVKSKEANIKMAERKESSDSLEDDISGIKLMIQSRHSRQCSTSSYNQKLKDIESNDIMAQSQPNWSPKRSSSNGQPPKQEKKIVQDQDMPAVSRSSIVRHSSAIDRVKDRSRLNDLKVSNNGRQERSALERSSNLLAEPIEEATEQEEEYSKVVTNKRNRFSVQ